MQINKELLKSLNPCTDRYKHFLKHHGEFNGSFSEFMDLPNLDYEDKIWVAVIVLTKNQLVKWSVLCVDSVVHIFEDKRPDDKRLSDCISYLKSINDFNNLTNAQALEIKKHGMAANAAFFSANATVYATNATYAAANAAYAVRCAASGAANAVQAAIYAAGAAAREARYATSAATSATNYAATSAATSATNYAATYDDRDSINYAAKYSQQALNLQFLKQVTSV